MELVRKRSPTAEDVAGSPAAAGRAGAGGEEEHGESRTELIFLIDTDLEIHSQLADELH